MENMLVAAVQLGNLSGGLFSKIRVANGARCISAILVLIVLARLRVDEAVCEAADNWNCSCILQVLLSCRTRRR